MTLEKREETFERWLREHLGLMLKVVRTSVSTSQDQEDLLQDILVNLWSSIPSFRGDSKETTWIYRVSIKTAMVWHRDEKRRKNRQSKLLQQTAPFGRLDPLMVTSDQALPSHQIEARERIEALYTAIRNLPKLDSSLALLHLEGLSYQEISEVLAISENYVGVKLNRIRKQLAEQLAPTTE